MIEGLVLQEVPVAHTDVCDPRLSVFGDDSFPFRRAGRLTIEHARSDGSFKPRTFPHATLYVVVNGEAHFTLTDLATEQQETCRLRPGKRLLVPAGISSYAWVRAGTNLLLLEELSDAPPASGT